MNTRFKSKCTCGSLTVVAVAAVAAIAMGKASAEERFMTVHSANFLDGGTLPLSMINNMPNANGMNACTASGAPGGNKSPQLSWKVAPVETQSFVVIIYDVVAQFTQWAIYNIPAETTSPPENAGVPGSSFGVQNGNDFLVRATEDRVHQRRFIRSFMSMRSLCMHWTNSFRSSRHSALLFLPGPKVSIRN